MALFGQISNTVPLILIFQLVIVSYENMHYKVHNISITDTALCSGFPNKGFEWLS